MSRPEATGASLTGLERRSARARTSTPSGAFGTSSRLEASRCSYQTFVIPGSSRPRRSPLLGKPSTFRWRRITQTAPCLRSSAPTFVRRFRISWLLKCILLTMSPRGETRSPRPPFPRSSTTAVVDERGNGGRGDRVSPRGLIVRRIHFKSQEIRNRRTNVGADDRRQGAVWVMRRQRNVEGFPKSGDLLGQEDRRSWGSLPRSAGAA